MSGDNTLRDQVLAHLRLLTNPAALTADDVEVLAGMSLCLGMRGAVALELRRMATPKKRTTKKTSSRRGTRHAKR